MNAQQLALPPPSAAVSELVDVMTDQTHWPTSSFRTRAEDWVFRPRGDLKEAIPFAFSNYQPARVAHDGLYYPTVEHAYWAASTVNRATRQIIRSCSSPTDARLLGLSMQTDQKDWRVKRVTIMWGLLWQKFALPAHHRRLMEFEGTISYWNVWHDRYWGQCICSVHNGTGMNMLGNLLMEIRELQIHAS